MLATTALFAFALLRIDPNRFDRVIVDCFRYIAGTLLQIDKRYNLLGPIFVLPLTAATILDRDWWHSDLLDTVRIVEAARENADSWAGFVRLLQGDLPDLWPILSEYVAELKHEF